jgi:hypothetical protein
MTEAIDDNVRRQYLSFKEIGSVRAGYIVFKTPSITANELLRRAPNWEIPQPRKANSLIGFRLGEVPIHFYSIYRPVPETEEFIAIASKPLGPRALNQLFLAISPDPKNYGLDTKDLVRDWKRFGKMSDTIREQHFEKLGLTMQIVERDRASIVEDIEQWLKSDFYPHKEHPLMPKRVPVIRWEKNGSNRRFILDYLEGVPYDTIRQNHIPENLPADLAQESQWLNPSIGVSAAAYFSPEATIYWLQHVVFDTYRQPMGSTQAFGYAIEMGRTILNADFINAAEIYIQDNKVELPELNTVKGREKLFVAARSLVRGLR